MLRPNVSRKRKGYELLFDSVLSRLRELYEEPLQRRTAATLWLLFCLRFAEFVPLPGFAHAAAGAAGNANVVNLLLPSDLGDVGGVSRRQPSPFLTPASPQPRRAA